MPNGYVFITCNLALKCNFKTTLWEMCEININNYTKQN